MKYLFMCLMALCFLVGPASAAPKDDHRVTFCSPEGEVVFLDTEWVDPLLHRNVPLFSKLLKDASYTPCSTEPETAPDNMQIGAWCSVDQLGSMIHVSCHGFTWVADRYILVKEVYYLEEGQAKEGEESFLTEAPMIILRLEKARRATILAAAAVTQEDKINIK